MLFSQLMRKLRRRKKKAGKIPIAVNPPDLQFIHFKPKVMGILKVVEIMSSSKTSWEDAAKKAVKTAGKTVKQIRSVYVQDMSAVVEKNDLTEFRVTVKISFEVMD